MDSSNEQALESLAVDSATAPGSRGGRASGGGPGVVRRKVFFLLDSLNVGGTETQAVELAIRLDSERYAVTLGCLRARGPLLERLAGSARSEERRVGEEGRFRWSPD